MSPEERFLWHRLNAATKRVTDDLGTRYQFNTVVSSLMELANDISDLPGDAPNHRALMGHALSTFARMLSPVAPHLAEQLWEQLGGRGFCMHAPWPDFDAAWLEQDEQLVVVQVNGKVRGRVTVGASATEEERRGAALACPGAQGHLAGKEILKVIVPPGGRLVSIVVKEGPKPKAEVKPRAEAASLGPGDAAPASQDSGDAAPAEPAALFPGTGGERQKRGKGKKK